MPTPFESQDVDVPFQSVSRGILLMESRLFCSVVAVSKSEVNVPDDCRRFMLNDGILDSPRQMVSTGSREALVHHPPRHCIA